MNVLYVASDPRMKYGAPTGYGSHIKKTVDALEARDIEVCRLIGGDLRDIAALRNVYKKLGRRVPRVLSKVKQAARDLNEIRDDLATYRLFRRLVKGKPCDLVYERMAPFRMVGYRLGRWLKVPVILEVNDPLYETFRFYPPALRRYALWVEKLIVNRAAGIIVGCEALADYYVNQGKPRDCIEVIYPTADYGAFPFEEGESERASDVTRIGFVGTMQRWHRVDLLLNAFARVLKENVRAVLELVGDGPEMNRMQRRCEDLGIRDSVNFHGGVPYESVPSVMRSFHICVIPNAMWYGSPTKLFEYGAMGKAVVGPRDTPVAEIIEDGVNGRLFALGDEKELAGALASLCHNVEERVALGHRLAKKLRVEITWERNIEAILKLAERNGMYQRWKAVGTGQ